MATLVDLRRRLQYKLSRTTNETSPVTGYSFQDELNNAINNAIKEIQRAHQWDNLKRFYTGTTTASVKVYSFPSDVNRVFESILIDGDESRRLSVISPSELDEIVARPENDTTAHPVYLIHWGTDFELYPIPDAAYTVWMRLSIWANALSGDSDTPNINNIDDVIIAGALVELTRDKVLLDDYGVYLGDFQRLLQSAIRNDRSKPDYSPRPILYNAGARYLGDFAANPFIMKVD